MAPYKLLVVFILLVFICSVCECDITYSIEEELPGDTLIGNISEDSGLSQFYGPEDMDKIQYSFLSGDTQYFSLDENSGIFKTVSKLDRDVICEGMDMCVLTVDIATVANVASGISFESFTVHVEVLDLNDNVPTFDVPSITLYLPENSMPGKELILPQARDPDTSTFTIRSYALRTRQDIPFRLERSIALDGTTDLKLILQSNIDREVTAFYLFTIIAEDGGDPPRSGTLNVNITVEDTNDHVPVFERQTYVIEIAEDTPVQTTFLTIAAYDVDTGLNGKVVYGFATRTQQRYGSLFGVRADTGELFTTGELDYETESIYQLVMTATDRGPDAQTSQCYVTVHLTDINDFVPTITVSTLRSSRNAQVLEHAITDTFVAHIRVVDEDTGAAGDVTCSLDSDHFRLNLLNDPSQYTIVTSSVFDRETRDEYFVNVICIDNGIPPLSSEYNLTVKIGDANDHAPVFTKSLYLANIEENIPSGEYILQVRASDDDSGENAHIEYLLSDSNSKAIFDMFSIEPKTGVLRTKVPLDHERNRSVDIEIVAQDKGEPAQSTVAHITLAVLDLNDNPPVFGQECYSFGVYENRREGEDAGNVVATDKDSQPYDSVFYSIQESDQTDFDVHTKFVINADTGYIKTRMPLDREQQDKYNLIIIAENLGYPGMSSSVSVTIYIADENDNSPVFDFPSSLNNTVYVSNLAQMGHVVTRVRGHDLDTGDNAKLSFHLKDGDIDKFELDSSNGAVTVNADLSDFTDMEFNLTIQAKDSGTPRRRQSTVLIIVITDGAATSDLHTNNHDKNFKDGPLPNFGIVIGVACGSTIVIALLAMAIIIIACIGRGQTRSKPGAEPEYPGPYKCGTTEAQCMLDGCPDARCGSESSGSQTNSPYKIGRYDSHVMNTNDVTMGVAGSPRNRNGDIAGSTPAIHMSNDLTRSPYDTHQIRDGTASLSRLHSPTSSQIPLSVCNGCVKPGLADNHDSTFGKTLLPPHTDKEIEIHKVIRYLQSQQDEADCETMSTSDSGRGNSFSDETPDSQHPRVLPNGGSHPKHVHFMPISASATMPHRAASPYQARTLEHRSSPTQRCGPNGSPNQRRVNHFSTFTSPNAKSGAAVKHTGLNGTYPKRQPARVTFQSPLYETQQYSSHTPPKASPLYTHKKENGAQTNFPVHALNESSAENFSDDSASTMSGSYVLQPDDRPRKTSSPTMLTPAVCKVLPTIQDSFV